MANYTKSTNFTAKDALTTGDPNKVIKGSEHDTEFDNLATASATKANKVISGTTNGILVQTSGGDLADGTLTLPTGAVVGISDTQTLTNKSIDSDNNTITNIVDADIKAAAAIDASKIGGGSVSTTEYDYLNGVTSAIQTQLNSKGVGDLVASNNLSDVGSASTSRSNLGLGTVSTLNSIANSNIADYVAGTTYTIFTDNSEGSETVNITTNTKVKEIYCPYGGTINVYFTLSGANSASPHYGRIYVNGAAAGTARSSSADASWSENISIDAGDFLQVYVYGTGGNWASVTQLLIRVTLPKEFIQTVSTS